MNTSRTMYSYLLIAMVLICISGSSRAFAQVSLATAVDLALSHSPRVRMAAADLDKAKATLAETRDGHLPTVAIGVGAAGYAWGYSPNPPSLFTFTSQGRIFDGALLSDLKAAQYGIKSAEFALIEAREGVEEEVSQSYLTLQHDKARMDGLGKEYEIAQRLVRIVSDRLDAGQDTAIALTQAKLTAAKINVALLKASGDVAQDKAQLALLLGLSQPVDLPENQAIPDLNTALEINRASSNVQQTPAVRAAYAVSDAKMATAKGDLRYQFWPQFEFFAQFNRYDTITTSFGTLQAISGGAIKANEEAVGIQVQIPLFDRYHVAKAREDAAEAAHSRAEADDSARNALSGRSRLGNSLTLLKAQLEVARFDQELARQQLDALVEQINQTSTNANGPQMTPKDEQNARIAEREKYLSLLDADFQLKQAQISLLRQSGGIEAWVKQLPTPSQTTPIP